MDISRPQRGSTKSRIWDDPQGRAAHLIRSPTAEECQARGWRRDARSAPVSRGFAGPEGTRRGGGSTARGRAHSRAASREAGAEAAGRRRRALKSAPGARCLRGRPWPLPWHRPARGARQLAGPRRAHGDDSSARWPCASRPPPPEWGCSRGLGARAGRKTLDFPRAGIMSKLLPRALAESLILYSQTLSF